MSDTTSGLFKNPLMRESAGISPHMQPSFRIVHRPTWERRGMPDTLDVTSIYAPPRKVRHLPFGFHLGREAEITYHFYHVNDDANASMRVFGAIEHIKKSAGAVIPIDVGSDRIESLPEDILLGLLSQRNVKSAIKAGNSKKIVTQEIERGHLSAAYPALVTHTDLPFRQSPLAGRTIMEIAKDPTAISIFVVIAAGSNAPIAIICVPVGIVAIHVAKRTGPRISRWVDNKLKEWLK